MKVSSSLYPACPFGFRNKEAIVEAVKDNLLVFDRPVRLRSSDMSVRQLTYTTGAQEICDQVGEAWLQDLGMIRGTLLDWLFAIFRAAESETGWPQRLLAAKVALLAKLELVPTDPLQTRPITIISRLYRSWSKYRSTQVLDYLRDIVPAAVGGGLSGTSADMLCALTLCRLEEARAEGYQLCGAVLDDIAKCYNAIPRVPLLALLVPLGLPREYIYDFAGALEQLVRHIEVLGHVSATPVPSSTGIPEGCAFSVACMAAISYLASVVVELLSPPFMRITGASSPQMRWIYRQASPS